MANYVIEGLGAFPPQGDNAIAHFVKLFEEDTMQLLEDAINLFLADTPGVVLLASPFIVDIRTQVVTSYAGVPKEQYTAMVHYILVGTP